MSKLLACQHRAKFESHRAAYEAEKKAASHAEFTRVVSGGPMPAAAMIRPAYSCYSEGPKGGDLH